LTLSRFISPTLRLAERHENEAASSGEICISLADLYISLRGIHISPEEICKSLIHLHKSSPDLPISSGDLCKRKEEIGGLKRRKRTRSVSEGQHRSHFGRKAKANTLALAHASGSFSPF